MNLKHIWTDLNKDTPDLYNSCTNNNFIDFRLTAKVLKEYEIDTLFRNFEDRRKIQIQRSRAQDSNFEILNKIILEIYIPIHK